MKLCKTQWLEFLGSTSSFSLFIATIVSVGEVSMHGVRGQTFR